MFFSVVFTAAGFLQIVLWYFLNCGSTLSASAADVVTVLSWIVGIVAGVFIVLIGVYCGFAMSYCKGVQFWNTGLLPLVFVLMGLADGLALTMGVNLATGGATRRPSARWRSWTRILLVVNALLIAGYLVRAYRRHAAAEVAAQDLIKGSTAWVFWILLVLLGIATPFVLSVVTAFMERQHRAAPDRRDRLPHDRRVRAQVLGPEGRHLPVRPSWCRVMAASPAPSRKERQWVNAIRF